MIKPWPEEAKPKVEKDIYIRMLENDTGILLEAWYEDGSQPPANMLLSIDHDGTIHPNTSINEDFGFRLVGRGQLPVGATR